MSTGNPLSQRQVILAVALETVAGTMVSAGSLVTGDTAFNAFANDGIFITPDDEAEERESPGSTSSMKSEPGASTCSVAFYTELANSGTGTAPLWFSRLLKGAGYDITAGTASPNPESASAATLTMAQYFDGVLEIAYGLNLDFSIDYESAKLVKVNWTGKGLYAAVTDATNLTRTGVAGLPPKFQNATVTFDGTGYPTPSVSFKANNEIVLREDGTAAGYRSASIRTRKPEFEILVEKATVATKDWGALVTAATEQALVVAVGSGSNNVVTLNAPNLQIRRKPVTVVRNRIPYWQLMGGANAATAAGGDDHTIVLS